MQDVSTKVRFTEPNVDDTQREEWSWLWENTVYSISELAIACGFKEDVVTDKMQVLIANRMIYPDGTLNSILERYLRQKVACLFKLRRGTSVSKGNELEGVASNEN